MKKYLSLLTVLTLGGAGILAPTIVNSVHASEITTDRFIDKKEFHNLSFHSLKTENLDQQDVKKIELFALNKSIDSINVIDGTDNIRTTVKYGKSGLDFRIANLTVWKQFSQVYNFDFNSSPEEIHSALQKKVNLTNVKCRLITEYENCRFISSMYIIDNFDAELV